MSGILPSSGMKPTGTSYSCTRYTIITRLQFYTLVIFLTSSPVRIPCRSVPNYSRLSFLNVRATTMFSIDFSTDYSQPISDPVPDGFPSCPVPPVLVVYFRFPLTKCPLIFPSLSHPAGNVFPYQVVPRQDLSILHTNQTISHRTARASGYRAYPWY